MRALPFAMLAATAAAGCDDSLDLHLIAPPGETTTRVSYDCVNRLEVIAYGDAATNEQTCFEVPPGAIRNLRDHDLDGLVAFDMPSGFYALDVRGVRSGDTDCGGADASTVFHGEAYYSSGWDLDVDLLRALDCAAYSADPTALQLLDLAKLLGTDAAMRCAPPANAEGYSLRLDHMYPYEVYVGVNGFVVEPASIDGRVGADGTATIPGPHFHGAVEPSCMIAGTTQVPVGAVAVASCHDPSQATLCAPAGGGEVIAISPDMASAFASTKQYQEDAISVGLVWDAATRRPIAGATVERLDRMTGLGFRTFDFAAGTVTGRTSPETSASGLFAIELTAPATLLVSAPGYRSRTVVVAALSPDSPGVQSIPLGR